ncbi:unnamed protein product [Pocillopora meandrina]|uniref:Uncharacterized protein n=1 Tax=Pocillopora meandrina TaxID=46732 RepID=A0AAU9VNA2_9CNID|nr:unnamed protein product [Pocillopora meandrina]
MVQDYLINITLFKMRGNDPSLLNALRLPLATLTLHGPKSYFDETSYEDLRPEIILKWQKNKVRSLGTWLSIDLEATVLLN